MNGWQQDFMRGYNQKNVDFFNEWCNKMYILVGDVVQCGIYEMDSMGYAFIAANCPEIGEEGLSNKFYLYDNNWRFDKTKNLRNGEFKYGSTCLYTAISNYKYKSARDLSWIILQTEVTPSVHRGHFIVCETPQIYNVAINNLRRLKRLFKLFIAESENIANISEENKFNLASVKPDYFIENDIDRSIKVDRLNALLKSKGVFGKTIKFTDRELQCMQLYCQGKSAKETGKILGISSRTIEGYFDTIKRKFKVSSKSEILDIII